MTTDNTAPGTAGELVAWVSRQFDKAGLHFGHGSVTPLDEAVLIVCHVMGLDVTDDSVDLGRQVSGEQRTEIENLVKRRIEERMPLSYLIHRAWFGGHEFYVDDRVLIPRSPIAELIENEFMPWVDPARVTRILDLCTGGACIALACAHAFPGARVDATDLAEDALEVARINVGRHGLNDRVRVIQSDLFAALSDERYDIIVSNPPYVGAEELNSLPQEFGHEPVLALAAGDDGLDAVRVILAQAARYLDVDGILIVEVGNTEAEVERVYPDVPFTWLDFERGGTGVFLLSAADLSAHAVAFERSVRKIRNLTEAS